MLISVSSRGYSLGDRHGENLSFEEGTGGLLHVDFNCLFDKGQTFEKPEVVPFRLTHNMVDAFGAYGYNGRYKSPASLALMLSPCTGPFRRTCEITLSLLRQNEDALMTILETFLHDPTTDFIGKRVSTDKPVCDPFLTTFSSAVPMSMSPILQLGCWRMCGTSFVATCPSSPSHSPWMVKWMN